MKNLKNNLNTQSVLSMRGSGYYSERTAGAKTVFKHDPHIDEVIDLGKKDFFNIINKISGEKSNLEWVAGIRFRIGASTGSVISKTNTVNLLFEEYGNHDINTLASRM